MTSALFIGRMQPLHKGHLRILRKALSEHDKLIIGIGCANKYCKNNKNPFSYEEVKKMIEANLQGNYEIIKINDCEKDDEWTKNIKKIVSKEDTIYSGNDWVINLLKNHCKIEKLDREMGISATQIRELIAKDDDGWRSLVPNGTIRIIEEIGIQEIKKTL